MRTKRGGKKQKKQAGTKKERPAKAWAGCSPHNETKAPSAGLICTEWAGTLEAAFLRGRFLAGSGRLLLEFGCKQSRCMYNKPLASTVIVLVMPAGDGERGGGATNMLIYFQGPLLVISSKLLLLRWLFWPWALPLRLHTVQAVIGCHWWRLSGLNIAGKQCLFVCFFVFLFVVWQTPTGLINDWLYFLPNLKKKNASHMKTMDLAFWTRERSALLPIFPSGHSGYCS